VTVAVMENSGVNFSSVVAVADVVLITGVITEAAVILKRKDIKEN